MKKVSKGILSVTLALVIGLPIINVGEISATSTPEISDVEADLFEYDDSTLVRGKYDSVGNELLRKNEGLSLKEVEKKFENVSTDSITEKEFNDSYKEISRGKRETRSVYNYFPGSAEKKACLKKYGAWKCYMAQRDSNEAVAETIKRFRRNGRNDKSDAFRHAYWNALMKHRYGNGFASFVATNHETFGRGPQIEKKMDLYNNAQGRYTSSKNKWWLGDQVIRKMNAGHLRYIRAGRLVPTNR